MTYRKVMLTVIASFLLIIMIQQSVDLVEANPYRYDFKMEGTIPAPGGTKPPTITFLNPTNYSIYPSNSLSLNFTASTEKQGNLSFEISQLSYKGNWQKDATQIDILALFVENNYTWTNSYFVDLANIPKGIHTIEIFATATAIAYYTHTEQQGIDQTKYFVAYAISSNSTVQFMVGNAPSILSVSIENNTYNSSSVPLGIITDIPIKQAFYNLDNSSNIIFDGNSTLRNLTNGQHSLTVYVIDENGTQSFPKTIYFNVDNKATLPILTIGLIVAAVAISSALLFIVLRHRKTAKP